MQATTPPPTLLGNKVTINCLRIGRRPKTDVFPVKIGLLNTVASLKELIIRAEGSSLRNMDASALRLWRVSAKGSTRLQSTQSPSSSEFIKTSRNATEMVALQVANYFGSEKINKPNAIHVLVVCTTPSPNAPCNSSGTQAPQLAATQETSSQPVLNATRISATTSSSAVIGAAASAPADDSSQTPQISHSTSSTPTLGQPPLLGDQLSINCLCLGRTSPDDVFSVRTGIQNTFADLLELIVISEGFWPKNIDPKSLTLWSVSMKKQAEVWSRSTWPSDLAFLQSLGNPIKPNISLSQLRSKHPENVHVIVNWSIQRNCSIDIAQEQSSLSEPAKATPSVSMEAELQEQASAEPEEAIAISLSEDASDESEPSSPSALSSSIVLVSSDSESVAMSDSSTEAALATFSSTAGAATASDYAPPNVSSQASYFTSSTAHHSESTETLAFSGEATIAPSSSPTAAAATVSNCASQDVSSLNPYPSSSTSHTFEPEGTPDSSPEAASAAFSSAAVVAATAPCCASPDVSSQISHPSPSSHNSSESERASTVTAVPHSPATADSGIAASVKQFPPIPLALLHRAFGAFIDDLADSRSSDRKSEFTSKLSDMLSNTATAEQRLLCFTHLLREQLGINLKSSGEAGTMIASVDGHAYIMLQSLGGSAFSSNGDPFTRCYKAYEEYVGRLSDDPSKLPVLPCLHIIICGPFMSFAGSAMACGAQHFEILLPAILFHPNPLYYGDAVKTQASRAFKALANAADALKRFYSDPSSRILNAPYPNIYRTRRGNLLVILTIEKRLELDSDDLVYRGLEDEVTPVVVGFTCKPREGKFFNMPDPGLRYAEQLPGGWYMAVRDPWDRLIEAGF